MNFLNALTSAFFKTAQDGSKIFYPWSLWVRGYTLASVQDQQRLQQQLKVYLAVSFVLILLAETMVSSPVSFGIAAVLTGFYVLWILYALRHLPRATEKMSLDESLTIQAHTHHMVVLWLFAVLALFAVGCSFFMFVAAPDNRFIALSGIVFFGLALAKATRMLVLRYSVAPRP
jgi:hypothetical protein